MTGVPKYVLGLLLIVGMLGSATATAASSSQSVQESEITRENISESLREYGGEEAITMANSTEFSAAREAWELSDDLVAQIDYQLDFRSKVDFMSSDVGHLADLLTTRLDTDVGSVEMGLYMTEPEARELERRDALGERMAELTLSFLSTSIEVDEGQRPEYDSNFGGIWMDQLAGGEVVLAVVDSSKLDEEALYAIVGGREFLRIIEQKYSYNETEAVRDTLEIQLEQLGLPPHVTATLTPKGRVLSVVATDPSAIRDRIGVGLPADSYQIEAGTPFRTMTKPSWTHNLSNQQPGLDIHIFDGTGGAGGCTWGFNGHSTATHYIITAGHCLDDYANHGGSNVLDVDIWQNGNSGRDLTTNPYVFSHDNSTYDVARVSSSYADDNCYHGNDLIGSSAAHCAYAMQNRSTSYGWDFGIDRTCASLARTNKYRCGFVVDDSFGPNRLVVDMSSQKGDSGSGAQWQTRIDGVLTDGSVPAGQSFFQKAYHVQFALGNGYFYFNCAVGETSHSNVSNWGQCPSVLP